jgi:hypothetical protein
MEKMIRNNLVNSRTKNGTPAGRMHHEQYPAVVVSPDFAGVIAAAAVR